MRGQAHQGLTYPPSSTQLRASALGYGLGLFHAERVKPPQVPSPFKPPDPGAARATVGEVIAMADQTLMQLAGEQGDALHTSVVAEPIAGDAHLATTAGFQDLFVEVGPSVDGDLAGGRITAWGEKFEEGRDHGLLFTEIRPYQWK